MSDKYKRFRIGASSEVDELLEIIEKFEFEAMKLKGRVGGLTRSNKKYKAENKQLKEQICTIQTAALTGKLSKGRKKTSK